MGGAIERQIGGVTESAGADSTADSAQDAAKRLVSDLDRVSLIQALIDTEAATARVIDLTERLVDARQQIVSLRGELEGLRIEYSQYKAEQSVCKRRCRLTCPADSVTAECSRRLSRVGGGCWSLFSCITAKNSSDHVSPPCQGSTAHIRSMS